MSEDGGFQAVRAAGENLQIRTVYTSSHFMLIFVVGPIQVANFYAFSAQRMRAARRRVRGAARVHIILYYKFYRSPLTARVRAKK